MTRNFVRALRATLVLALLTGIIYPVALTGIAKVLMPGKAEGSLVRVDGRVVGSSLVGQAWDGSDWFHGRPSAVDYDAASSGGSNLGPNSRELADQIEARVQAILELESPYQPNLTVAGIPVDLLTASGSGLDPDISVEAARLQAPRIAERHDLPLQEVLDLIADATSQGPERVNVLSLNLQLQRLEG
jgi:K+-transporting ATPase ATPase C chain